MTELTSGGSGNGFLNKQRKNSGLTGKIPTELGALSKMESDFALSTNALSSTIPSELGKVFKLSKEFALEDNNLQGMATELGMLVRMSSLFVLEKSAVPTSTEWRSRNYPHRMWGVHWLIEILL